MQEPRAMTAILKSKIPRIHESALVGTGAGAARRPVRGEAVLALAGGGATRVAELYQKTPLRVLRLYPERGDAFAAVLVNTSGGMVAGDSLDVDIRAGAGARALVMPQAAEKVYRSPGPDCHIEVRLSVGADGWLEWLPQEAILFEGARLRRRMSVELDRRARLLAGEITVFGRRARGERFTRGLLRDDWRVLRDGRAVWADAFSLDGDVGAVIDHPAGLGGAEAMATAIYAGPDAAKRLDRAREIVDGATVEGLRSGVTHVGGLLLARWLGDARAVRRSFGSFWAQFRHAAVGLPAALPRLWHI